MTARPLGFHQVDGDPDQPPPPTPSPELPITLPEVREDCLVVLGKVNALLGDALERSQGAKGDRTPDRHMLAMAVRHLADALDELESAEEAQ
jgi:hypothetical protein